MLKEKKGKSTVYKCGKRYEGLKADDKPEKKKTKAQDKSLLTEENNGRS